LNATNDFGPVTVSVQANQNYNLTNLLTKQGRSHPLDAVLGKNNLDVTANFGDQLGLEFMSGSGQNPSIRLVRGLGSGDFSLGGEYNLRTHNGTISVLKRFGDGWIIRLNANTGSVGAELRFEPGR
jgi:hypothetical protein